MPVKPTEIYLKGGRQAVDLSMIVAPDNLNIKTVAHSLGNLCRFTGHTSRFYSVAEHSVHCAILLADAGATLEEQRAALMHDAGECLTGDISTPLGRALGFRWTLIKAAAQEALDLHFGIHMDEDQHRLIKWADTFMTVHEAKVLGISEDPIHEWGLPPCPPPESGRGPALPCWTPNTAANMFLRCYEELTRELSGLDSD